MLADGFHYRALPCTANGSNKDALLQMGSSARCLFVTDQKKRFRYTWLSKCSFKYISHLNKDLAMDNSLTCKVNKLTF